MSHSGNISPNEVKDGFKQQKHTYTPQSHEELLKRLITKGKDVDTIAHENEYLKKELNTSKKQLESLQKRIEDLENRDKNKVKIDVSKTLATSPDSQSGIQSDIETDSDDEYVKSWEVLGHHFNEVIRRHNEVLAEKDRLIRQLQEQQLNRDILDKLSSCPIKDRDSRMDKYPNADLSKYMTCSTPGLKHCCSSNKYDMKNMRDQIEAGPSESFECESDCDCMADREEDDQLSSGEILRDHFNEVIRRHKEQMQEKELQIRELQQALKGCVKPDESKGLAWVQDCPNSPRTSELADKLGWKVISVSCAMPHFEKRNTTYSSFYTPRSVDRATNTSKTSITVSEEEHELGGSTDTFMAIDNLQRLDNISNLENLRRNLLQRLELEEKLDQLYWQKELNRYRKLRKEENEVFDVDNTFIKDFEMLETTRLELLRGLKDVKDSADSKMYDDQNQPIQFPDGEKKRVSFHDDFGAQTLRRSLYGS